MTLTPKQYSALKFIPNPGSSFSKVLTPLPFLGERDQVFEQEQIVRALELSLGILTPEQIEFVTDNTESTNFAE